LGQSEKGYKVLVVEKGKWCKNSEDFAKSNWNLRKWLWMPGIRFFGIMKITILRHISIISGTGVGGGSLVYANTLPRPSRAFYESGSWAGLLDWEEELDEHYSEALRMLGATKNPKLFDADKALKDLAIEIGKEGDFSHSNVAVYFGEAGKTSADPYFNGEGPTRTGCIHCGGCMTGCRYNAKNTLDKNYLYFAQRLGTDIFAENEVIGVKPINLGDGGDGYKISMRSSTKLFGGRREVSAKGVIFSGGVLGTVKLLLKLISPPTISERRGKLVDFNFKRSFTVPKTPPEKMTPFALTSRLPPNNFVLDLIEILYPSPPSPKLIGLTPITSFSAKISVPNL
jgi:cholesterol oxidase